MKNLSASKFNKFTFFKLPAAFWTGVRLKELSSQQAVASVKYKWINTNPFKSMYFAVQSMAAELSTGAIVAKQTMENKHDFAMLVVDHKGSFSKKAVGRINFTCTSGNLVKQAIEQSIETNEPQKITMISIGKDKSGDEVSRYEFTWSIKKRSKK